MQDLQDRINELSYTVVSQRQISDRIQLLESKLVHSEYEKNELIRIISEYERKSKLSHISSSHHQRNNTYRGDYDSNYDSYDDEQEQRRTGSRNRNRTYRERNEVQEKHYQEEQNRKISTSTSASSTMTSSSEILQTLNEINSISVDKLSSTLSMEQVRRYLFKYFLISH